MKKFLAPLFLLTLFAAFAAGCGSTGNIMVGLKTELTGIDHTAGGTQVSWRLVNPNVVPYLVAKATHRIYLDGVLVGTIHDDETVAVPAQNNLDRRHPLQAAGPAAERALAAASAAGSASYRVESSLLIRLYGDTTEKTSLTSSGKVPFTGK
jgi:hypothetical protein